jgi:hypothetical protein
MVSNINNMCRLHNRDKGKMTTILLLGQKMVDDIKPFGPFCSQ